MAKFVETKTISVSLFAGRHIQAQKIQSTIVEENPDWKNVAPQHHTPR